jgi:hypothetical protein
MKSSDSIDLDWSLVGHTNNSQFTMGALQARDCYYISTTVRPPGMIHVNMSAAPGVSFETDEETDSSNREL